MKKMYAMILLVLLLCMMVVAAEARPRSIVSANNFDMACTYGWAFDHGFLWYGYHCIWTPVAVAGPYTVHRVGIFSR